MKFSYKLFLAVGSWLLSFQLNAQTEQTQSFTLEQCIDYALGNSITMQNSKIDEEIAKSKIKETIGIGLPQINGNVNATNNPQLQRFFGRKTTIYNFVNSSANPVPYDEFFPTLGDNDVLASPSFFQLKNSLAASATVNQLIFNGSYLVGLKAASTYKDVAIKTTSQNKEQTIVQVTKTYYAAIINNERMKLFDNNIARVDSLLKSTTALNKNGFAESIDVDRIQVSLNNLITEKANFERVQILSIELLKFQMNYPMDQPLELKGNIEEIPIGIDLDGYLKDWDYKKRPDYLVLEANRQLQHFNVKNKYAAGMPVLSANATLGYSKQATTFGNLFSAPPSAPDQLGIGVGTLYPYSSIGFTLSVPIFSGLQRSYQVQQEKLKLKKIDNSYKTLESSIDLEIKQAISKYQTSITSLESQNKNMALAEKVARITKIKYEQGIGSNIEVVDAESSLKQSQVNYFNAMYDAIVAKTDLDKAFNKILPAYNK